MSPNESVHPEEQTHVDNAPKPENIEVLTTEEVPTQDPLVEMKDRWMRSVAELENVRRRSQKEKEDALKFGAMSFARDMVSVADDIHRALLNIPQTAQDDPSLKAFLDGIQMIGRAFETAFEKQGVHKVPSVGHIFDPHCHQAMFEVESIDVPAGQVVQVLQEGYTLHERLIRPALVGVSKEPVTALS